MKITVDSRFEVFEDSRRNVFETFPDVFGDSRGFFCEAYKAGHADAPDWFGDMSWVRQVNRSSSGPGVVRGCHAQVGRSCQAKYVQSLTQLIYDVITDARPDSRTFGSSSVYVLDPAKQNAVFVPRGFLHAFVVPLTASGPALFEYWCDAEYDKASETGVNPMSILPDVVRQCRAAADSPNPAVREYARNAYGGLYDSFSDGAGLVLSEKDTAAESWDAWSNAALNEYARTGKRWYE